MFIIPRRTLGILAGLATAGLVVLLGSVWNDPEFAARYRPLVKTAGALIREPRNRPRAPHATLRFADIAGGDLGHGRFPDDLVAVRR
jgi:hypothetical protein